MAYYWNVILFFRKKKIKNKIKEKNKTTKKKHVTVTDVVL